MYICMCVCMYMYRSPRREVTCPSADASERLASCQAAGSPMNNIINIIC